METIALDPDRSDTTSVVLFDLDLSRVDLDTCFLCLDDGERARAARFRHRPDSDRFVARRGRMRQYLADQVGRDPGDLRIAADDHGKPALVDHPDLVFSLSHSHGIALIATRRGGQIGCDIEWRNPDLACRTVAQRLFHSQEYTALAALPKAEWTEGFYNCWTRKEAYVKAIGLGLSYPLTAFAVSVAPADPAHVISPEPGWILRSFTPLPGFQAALATRP